MKALQIILLFTLVLCLNGFTQTKIQFDYRVEKQAMSTPMSNIEDAFFMNYYYSKPVNINFNGSSLKMKYDNGVTFVNKDLTEVGYDAETDDEDLVMETFLFTDNTNASDTISLIIDHQVGYVQLIVPTKNSKGDYVGYTSFRQFIKEGNLAMK